jgi:hypothetical protein
MRTKFISAILLGLATTVTLAEPLPKMEDPLFGIVYDPQQIHFDAVPVSLMKRCPDLRHQYVEAWIFGHLKTADSEYFLISGLVQYHDQVTGAPTEIAPDETDGLVAALRDSKCLVDQADYFLSQQVNPARNATPIMVPRSVVSGILQDAFRRDARAFGGKQRFLEKVNRNAIGPPIVLEELERFEMQRQ